MIGFNISRAKFLSMPEPRRHKWLARWFADLYAHLQTAALSDAALEMLRADYDRALTWMDQPPRPERPRSLRAWSEWAADGFHRHQAQTGLGLGEEGFLVPQGDTPEAGPWQKSFDYWVAAEKLRSAFNLGSILRSTDALGLAGVICGPEGPSPGHNQVRKAAMGTQNWVPTECPADFWAHIDQLKQAGYALIGVEKAEPSIEASLYPWPAKGVLLLGNEEYGLSETALSRAQALVHLPMRGRKNSMNVGAAFAALGLQLTLTLEGRHA